ncbi:hypothetical protein WMY93_011759 [Mugilogobius chulae]|uniref:MINAR1 N-terminal helical domain-containing protein n=1 Tax=Mugilogobius chulae TaxID=88201 RepID=A0AAW0PFK8_9GOBI
MRVNVSPHFGPSVVISECKTFLTILHHFLCLVFWGVSSGRQPRAHAEGKLEEPKGTMVRSFMMSQDPQDPELLLQIVEELSALRQWLSFQELCRAVSSRFPIEQLLDLRVLLFSAAARDPCFPATLFRQRVATRGRTCRPSL